MGIAGVTKAGPGKYCIQLENPRWPANEVVATAVLHPIGTTTESYIRVSAGSHDLCGNAPDKILVVTGNVSQQFHDYSFNFVVH